MTNLIRLKKVRPNRTKTTGRMRSLSLFSAGMLVAMLAISAGASAQTAAPSPASAASPAAQGCGGGNEAANPMRGIQLTPAQRQQLKQIRAQFRAQYPCGTKVPASARQQLRSEIMGVLTPAQQAQYQANVNAMHSPPPN
jgi:Spy/CpxP family protein refolding chaperone